MKNAVGGSIDISLDESRTVDKYFSLLICQYKITIHCIL